MKFLRRLNCEEDKTIIMVTHDDEVAHHARRIEYLKDGVVQRTIKGKKHVCNPKFTPGPERKPKKQAKKEVKKKTRKNNNQTKRSRK